MGNERVKESQGFVGVLVTWIGTLLLVFLPLPFGPMKRAMVGRETNAGYQFYCHPRFLLTMHLVWSGWLVGAIVGLNLLFPLMGLSWSIPLGYFGAFWLVVLLLTILVMGIDFSRVGVGFLFGGLITLVVVMWAAQAQFQLPVFGWVFSRLGELDVTIGWGIPVTSSAFFGIWFAVITTWRRMEDVWQIENGNYLNHYRFQRRDAAIPKAAKSFAASWPCLLARFLFFGWGDVVINDYKGDRVIREIQGVLFASHHAETIMAEFRRTDVTVGEDADEQIAAEAAESELGG